MSAATVPVPTIRLPESERPDCGVCGERGESLVEIAPDRGRFVARCSAHLENTIGQFEPHLTAEAEPAPPVYALTPEQRTAIFAGDHTAIKLEPGDPKPDVQAGDTIVLAMSRGGKQFLAKTEYERRKRVELGEPLLAEIPSEPTVWITFLEPKLKEGRWQLAFEAHDTRESVRTLAAAPSGHRQAGLKTRQRKRVPKKGEYKPPKLSDDAARGYGGGGNSTVDEREGIDDATLDRYRQLAEEQNLRHRTKQRQAAKAAARESRVAEGRKRHLAKAAGTLPLSVDDTAPLNSSAESV